MSNKNKQTLTLKPAPALDSATPTVDQAAIDAAAEQARKDQEAADAAAAEQAQREADEAAEKARLEAEAHDEQVRKDKEAADAAEAQRLADEQAAALAAANQGDSAQPPQADKPTWAIGDEVHLVPVHGIPLHHLLISGLVFGAEPTLAVIDAFIALQLEHGKLAIHGDN